MGDFRRTKPGKQATNEGFHARIGQMAERRRKAAGLRQPGRRRQAGNGAAVAPDVVAGFPRGLPDGNPHRPLATARWPSEAETFDMLGRWQPGRFLIGRDSAGRYIGHEDDRHILPSPEAGRERGYQLDRACAAHMAAFGHLHRSEGRTGDDHGLPPGPRLPMGACRCRERAAVYVLDPFKRVTGPAAKLPAVFQSSGRSRTRTRDEGLEMAGQIADALVIQQEGAGGALDAFGAGLPARPRAVHRQGGSAGKPESCHACATSCCNRLTISS